MERRVVVTGLGLMTGLGLDLETSWKGLLEGRRPARRLTLFDPEGLETVFGVELPEGAAEVFAKHVKTRNREQMTRGTMIAVSVAAQALDHSGLDLAAVDKTRVAVVVGGTGTGYAPGPDADPNRILRNMASAPAAWISLKYRFQGPSMVTSTACSSGTYALHAAHRYIAAGEVDVAVAGAADCTLNRLDVAGFNALMALSEARDDFAAASRPFDRRRTGFVMGEGGGMLVLESEEHARARGARILAVMHRPGLASEGYNILSPEPDGKGMARTMRLALAHAGLQPRDIGYLNAHGTSTTLNDLYETQAIREVWGEDAGALAVSSTKSAHGHCLAGAAGVEAVVTVKALVEGVLPPTVNLTDPDPALDLDYVPNVPRVRAVAHAMSNSFAFGGQNGCAIFSRPDGVSP